MNRIHLCESCNRPITQYEDNDSIYILECMHVYHHNCLNAITSNPTEQVHGNWISRCRRCSRIIEPHDPRQIDFQTQNIPVSPNDPHSSQRNYDAVAQWQAFAVQLSNKCNQLRTELARSHTENAALLTQIASLQNQQMALWMSNVTPAVQIPPFNRPEENVLQPGPSSQLIAPSPVPPTATAQSSVRPSNLKQEFLTPTFPKPKVDVVSPVVPIPRPGESFMNLADRKKLLFDKMRELEDRKKELDQRRKEHATLPRKQPPPTTSGTKRSSSSGHETSQTARKHSRYSTTDVTPACGTNSTQTTTTTDGAAHSWNSPGTRSALSTNTSSQPADNGGRPLIKRGTTREKGSNKRRYRNKYKLDAEELRPFYPLNSFPRNFMAGGFEIDENNHYVVFFARNVILIGDGHINTIVRKLAMGKPYESKIHPKLYGRNLTIQDLVNFFENIERFPRRIMISIGNYDTHIGTDPEEFQNNLVLLLAKFEQLGVTEIVLIPLLPNPREEFNRAVINTHLNSDHSAIFSGTITRIDDDFRDLHCLRPYYCHEGSGPYYMQRHYKGILHSIAIRFITILRTDQPTPDPDTTEEPIPVDYEEEDEELRSLETIQNEQSPEYISDENEIQFIPLPEDEGTKAKQTEAAPTTQSLTSLGRKYKNCAVQILETVPRKRNLEKKSPAKTPMKLTRKNPTPSPKKFSIAGSINQETRKYLLEMIKTSAEEMLGSNDDTESPAQDQAMLRAEINDVFDRTALQQPMPMQVDPPTAAIATPGSSVQKLKPEPRDDETTAHFKRFDKPFCRPLQ